MSLRKEVPPTHYFSLCNGVMLKNAQELAFALEYIDDDELRYHVNSTKNDFSAWIKDVFGDHLLAAELSKADSRENMRRVLLKHIEKRGDMNGFVRRSCKPVYEAWLWHY